MDADRAAAALEAQIAGEFSGGEAQRVKLATELHPAQSGGAL